MKADTRYDGENDRSRTDEQWRSETVADEEFAPALPPAPPL
jgi:hypothetical protein